MRPSPARKDSPEPTAWLPLPDLDTLPDLEELLAPENLVDSGQTIAINSAIQALLEPTVAPAVDPIDPAISSEDATSSIAKAYEARRAASARVRTIRVRHALGERRNARLQQRRRHLALVSMIVAGALVVTGGLMALMRAGVRDVRLQLDGIETAARTRSSTVGEFLRERGVVLGADDRSVPPHSAALASGMRIEVRRATDAALDVDGQTRTIRTTARSLAELRAEQNIAAEFVAVSATPELNFGAPIAFRSPRSVTVTVDGSTTRLDTTALTPRELFPMMGIVLGGRDEVTPGLDTQLVSGAEVAVVRLADDQRTEVRAIPFTTQQRPDPSLAPGQTRVIQEGQAGSQRLTFRQLIRNGRVASEQLISTVTIQAPRSRILAVGRTGQVAAAAPARGASQGSESGQATWYAYTPGTCAHKTLPKGTVVTVINLATGASTTCVVADRGPYADGRIIDLTPSVFSRLAPLSTGVIDVRIEW
ncbi:MAG: ubiquitin-like domain-containing protein [Acidimicrobiia bacterium]